MSALHGRILIVDDEPKMATAVATALRRSGHRCVTAPDAREALRIFADEPADVVVTDRRMPEIDGIELMRRLRADDPELPVILITAYGDVRSAVEAMRDGAFDYLTKPFDLDELRTVVRRALELRALRDENHRLRVSLAEHRGGAMIAESPAMRAIVELVERVAPSHATVLIEGESGTGKEVVARRIHHLSPRADAPFIGINCKAFAPGVLESELFGHEKGAFTGAERQRLGCFERAAGGTLFLDEIGETDTAFQAKLLRVIQEGELVRVGGDTPIPTDVRLLAATNRDMRAAIDDGSFREDLYYRLAVIPVRLPPLRERPGDIGLLAHHFLSHDSLDGRSLELAPSAERMLVEHDWPGNVRELRNVIERASVLARGEAIEVEDLMLDQSHVSKSSEGEPQTLQATLDDAARARIETALRAHDSRGAAAGELGIDRTTLFRWIKRLGM
ncbi:MAG: sigma-54 dependent transcriptional regulator [Acidobacteriota bacterium]